MKYLWLMVMTAMLVLISGCEMPNDVKIDEDENARDNKTKDSLFSKKDPRYIISFHEIIKYPRASDIERPIITMDNKKIYININQFVHSSDIMDASLISLPNDENYFNLRLRFSRAGAIKWHSMALNFKGQEMAMLLDGSYLMSLVAQPLEDEDDEWVIVRGPFDRVTARGIAKNAARNYEIFTPDPSRLF